MLTGSAFDDIANAVEASQSRDVIVSNHTFQLLEHHVSSRPVLFFPKPKTNDRGQIEMQPCVTGLQLIDALRFPMPDFDYSPLWLSSLHDTLVNSQPSPLWTPLRAYVPRCALAHIDSGATDWMAELRRVSVIFVNLSGLHLTEGASCRDPRQCNMALIAMNRVIQSNGGYRRQFLVDDKGCVIIVVFGVPPLFAHEDDSYRALKTSLELKLVLKKLRIENSIGISTGNAYCGAIGCALRQEHAVIGDAVNTAARLAAASSRNEHAILCDSETQKMCSDKFLFLEQGQIKVKGKQTVLNVYSPLGVNRVTPSSSSAPTALFGRDAELSILLSELASLQAPPTPDYRGRIIWIEAAPGFGRTALARYIWNKACARYPAYFLSVDASDRRRPLSAIRAMLESQLQLSEFNSSPDPVQARYNRLQSLAAKMSFQKRQLLPLVQMV